MNKFRMVMIALLALFSLTQLTACKSTEDLKQVPVHSISQVYIPQDAFDCLDKPTKPTPIAKPDGTLGYLESQAGKLLNDTEKARADCKTQIEGVRTIYNLQIESSLQQKPDKSVDRAD